MKFPVGPIYYKEMEYRISLAVDAGVPIVNYGIAIAAMNGVLE